MANKIPRKASFTPSHKHRTYRTEAKTGVTLALNKLLDRYLSSHP